MTSVNEAEAVQDETRPDGGRPGEEMGDFPGKGTVARDVGGGRGDDREQREEADGAADAESVGFARDVSETASGLNGSLTEVETPDGSVIQQEEDTVSVDLSFVQMNTALVVDDSTDTSVTPASPPRRMKGPCSCDACKDRRDVLTEQLEEVTRLQGLWMELRQHIRSIFKAAMDIPRNPNSPRSQYDKIRLLDMHDIVIQLCKRDPHQLFIRLEGQVQEFVVEAKVRLLELLHNRNVNNLAEIFLTGLLDGYDALLSAASQLSGLVESLQKEHLCKFNLTWECLNKRLYQSCVYTDPLVQNNLPPFIGQLRKLLPLKGAEYQGLVHRYLAFDDEMTRIGDLWPETERLIDKYNQEQAALKAKQRMLREDWELFKARRKLIQQRMWNKTANELREFDEQLLTLASLGAVGALSPNGDSSNPGLDLGLDSLNLPLDSEILESLVQDSNKSTHLRLADMMGALTATDGQIGPNGHNDGPPVSPAGHCNEPEYWFGYECAVNHVLTYGFVTPPPSPRSISPANGERGDGEGSEGEEDIGSEEQRCECHVCTVPLMSPTRIGKGPPVNVNLHARNYSHFPPISNGFAGPTNCKAENGAMDINGVYPHLYNLHSSFGGTPVKPSSDARPPSMNSDDKTSPFGPQAKKKSEEVDSRKKLPEEVENNVEDTDLRKAEAQPCPCVYQHAKEIAERKKEMLENPPCPCLLKSKKKWDLCPCLKKTRDEAVVANGHAAPQSPAAPAAKTTPEARKPVIRPVGTQSAQTQTRHSTTQTPNTTHNHNHAPLQGPTHAHAHGPLPDLVKGTGTAHRAHSHSHAPHACHKQANVEHIKRVSCNDLAAGDGDCSDSGSSQEDSCSTSSSTPRDSSRHCDCCYCEVFGHGVSSVAPVSRNYNEMRERLRQLLTKKKAKKCKAACSPPKSPVESPVSDPNSNPKAVQPAPRPNTPVSTIPIQQLDQRDQRDLEALLEFIEGNQNGKRDNKKAEKKARQKQKKMEEKLKKDKQEVEKQRLIELQKKTPEVTITVVDPQKPVTQRLLPQRTLPEVSILPAPAPVPVARQSNKKKDRAESTSNNHKAKPANGTSSAKAKTESNVDKVDGSQKSKNDRVDPSKSRTQTTVNVANAKNSNSQTAATATATSMAATAKSAKASKKERQKLKRIEAKAKEEALLKEPVKAVQPENQPQIVTIKRVMESNSAEPTVTITLKGQTPAEDKVLFTLVNGQTKETSQKSEQNSNAGGKKKKNKGSNNQQQQGAKTNATQQQQNNGNLKQRQTNTNENKNVKQQQSSNEKAKSGKLVEDKKQQNTIETKSSRSKKDRKNTENKENVQQQNNANKGKNQEQQQNASNKKQKKPSTAAVAAPKQQQPQQQLSSIANNESQSKKSKGQPQERNNQTNNNNKSKNSNINNSNANRSKNEPQKSQNKVNQNLPKQQSAPESYSALPERRNSPLSSQFKDIGANSKINIENLKLPPGITITKVDAPAKPLPIRSAPMPKPVNPPKQTTIIAAPMSGVQSSYANPQSGGNVIVVDTGKLKQDLLPKSNERDSPRDNQQTPNTTGKKKKKKGKNASNANNTAVARNNTANAAPTSNDRSDEPARILHNPGSNMVTIRNPAFGPPKMEPTQQAAIIKVSENGMVTIRSPALQQAINAGLTPPPKPDFIVKGDLSTVTKVSTTQANSSSRHNGMISSNLAELRSRLTPDCTGLTGLANIQISKVTSGQPIPENGINLKGTSVTLTKVRNEAVMDDVQQAKTAVREAISATMAASGSGKGKKKKKKGNGSRQSGDDWNLVESVFTPKDIDPEDGEMDDAERELEAFKRFCLQSVPPARKEKVNLNIKDIVLKKKSSAVIAAN